MAQDEEAHSHIYFSVFDVPAGQNKVSEAVWFTSAIADTSVEIGAYHYEFCGWFTEDTGRL